MEEVAATTGDLPLGLNVQVQVRHARMDKVKTCKP